MKSNNKHHKPRYLYSSVYMWILCGIFCLMGGSAFAAYLENVPVTLTQPDGTIIECFATGDEYYNWVHDKDGYTIIQNPTTGYYCYAIRQGDELVASQYVVGKSNPLNTTLKPHANIPPEKMLMHRENILRNMKKESAQTVLKSTNKQHVGTLNNIVVYIRFSDQAEFSANQSYYTSLFNNETGNSMKNYFREISYNKLAIHSHFYPTNNGVTIVSYQDSHERNYYCPYSEWNTIGYNNDTERRIREHNLLEQAINYIKDQIPNSLNLDCNNDGLVDNICFIVKGGTTPYASLLWPHQWSLYTKTITINGKRVYDYNFHLENSLSSNNNAVLCHEMGHTFGAPDLYHSSNDAYPVSHWDIMATHGKTPQYMGAYLKYKYTKWINDMPSISAPGIYTLQPLSSPTNNCYKIPLEGTTEYLVLEYRQCNGIFETSSNNIRNGLLIYRINEQYNGNIDGIGYCGVTDEVYIFRPGETSTRQGTVSQANFSNTYNRTEFNKTTNPHCFISDGSTRDIYIKNITENADGTLSFGFSYCGNNDKVFSNTSSLPNSTNVSGSLRTTGTVTVKATDNVVFQATDYIELGVGFEVKEGGTFTANVTGCK